MSSWRDGVSDEIQAELDKAWLAAVTFAEQMLEREGAFHPYAVKLTDSEALEMVTVPAGAEDALQTLLDGLAAQRGALRVGAVVAAMHLESIQSDAVRVDIEHREGVALTLVLPYTRKKFRKKVEWGDTQSMLVEPRIWRG
ncbi:MAG TPA: hypothetical protein VM942_03185 [Acidimicrobiales bacterium]|nr:hypothetical protein [Acidimicrobiales bacterium]